MRKLFLSFAALMLSLFLAKADEGMWMVHAINSMLMKEMSSKGLTLTASDLYSEETPSIKDAIVSLDFGCTGSMISPDGLLITNHHCAYSDVHTLSVNCPAHNYLEDGFFAATRADEVPIPGKSAFFLKKVIDVTDEYKATIESEKAAGRNAGFRRMSFIMEKKYAQQTGLEANLYSMWAGSRYYMALYEVYKDLRLVAAPPVSIAAFGGDIDNWEWPQHKCDFAIYRIYTAPDGSPALYAPENVPMHPQKYLKISTEGLSKGDFAFIMGYPGRTNRYSSSARLAYDQATSLPISNAIRKAQMDIIKSWMDKDPEVRLKYSNRFFSLSNIQENKEGLEQCVDRFGVIRKKQRHERRYMKTGRVRGILDTLGAKFAAVEPLQRDLLYYRETIVRGSALSTIAMRLRNAPKAYSIEEEYSHIDLRLEKDLLRYDIETFFENVSDATLGPFHKDLKARFGKDYDAMFAAIWKDGMMQKGDSLYRFLNDVSIGDVNREIMKIQGEPRISDLERDYTREMFRLREERGELQYPDANSSMRLTYGTVGSFRRDGKKLPWQTWGREILQKEDPSSYDFHLLPEWKSELQEKGLDVPVNFLTDHDITGGNSGSPVLNARGELVGLAFDGNKESLASDVFWTEGYTKCVNVDIRFVIWTLRNFAGLENILSEINQ